LKEEGRRKKEEGSRRLKGQKKKRRPISAAFSALNGGELSGRAGFAFKALRRCGVA
jgi:hypothetical protein